MANLYYLLFCLKNFLIAYLRKLRISLSQSANDVADADAYLSALYPDNGSSCICKNNIDPVFDLHIIVPVYKVEKYIKQCIDSILNQETSFTYCVTIVNDGSPDKSREILKQYEGRHNVFIIDQDNKGFSGARNAALSAIKGKYLMFVDSDDMLAPNSINALLTAAIHKDADIVEGAYSEMAMDGKIRKTISVDPSSSGKLRGFAWGKVYRSNLFQNVQFPENYWFEDTINYLLVHDIAKVKSLIPDNVYLYRKNMFGISLSSFNKPKNLDGFYIMRRLLNDRKELGLPFDEQFYDVFLSELSIVFSRTLKINDKYIGVAVFNKLCELHNTYFKDTNTKTASLKKREMALKTNNVKLFVSSL